ncbi:RNA-dependent RNA polymerase [Parry's Creek negev-like virus 1]|nr:RNA-dependent RNA polymerase [Parry's Creek negev-like virus 1]
MDVLKTVGVSNDFSVKALYNQRILSQRDTTLNDLIDEAITQAAAADKAVDACKPTKVISQVLHIDQRNALASHFPAYNLEYTNKDLNCHGMAAAITKLSYDHMLDSISYNKLHSARAKGVDDNGRPYDDYVSFIGGNPAKFVKQCMHAVHSCNPILDCKDSVRRNDRVEQIRLHLNHLNNKKDKSFDDHTAIKMCQLFLSTQVISCDKLAQDCHRTSRYIIAVDSTYDISLKQLADIMVKKRAVFMKGCVMFDASILKQQRGKIAGIDATFRKENGQIVFNFTGDMSIEYRHDLKNYLAYFTSGNFYNSDMSALFQIEMLENRLGVQYFKVCRVTHSLRSVDAMSHSIWFTAMQGMTVVTCYTTDLNKLARGRNRWWGRWSLFNREKRRDIGNANSKLYDTYDGVFKKRYALVKTSIIDRLRNFAFGSTEQKFKATEIFNYLRSITSEVFFGNEIVKRDDPLDNATMMAVSLAVYVEQYLKKYDLGKAQQQLIIDINADRALALKSIPFKIFHSRDTCYDSSAWPIFGALHAMAFWLKSSSREYERMLVPAEEYLPQKSSKTNMFSIAEMKVRNAIGNCAERVEDALNRKSFLKYEYRTTHNFSYCPVAVRALGDDYCAQIAHNIKENFCVDTTTTEIRSYLDERIDEVLYGSKDDDCSINYNDTVFRWKVAINHYLRSDLHDECENTAKTISSDSKFMPNMLGKVYAQSAPPDLIFGEFGDHDIGDENTRVETYEYGQEKEYYYGLLRSLISHYYHRGTSAKIMLCNALHDRELYIEHRRECLAALDRYKQQYEAGLVRDSSEDMARSYASPIEIFERDIMKPSELDVTPALEPLAALQLIENLVAVSGTAYLFVHLSQLLIHFDKIHAVSRWFKSTEIKRQCYWHSTASTVVVVFNDRRVPMADYTSCDLTDFKSSKIKLMAQVHKLMEHYITDLYRACEGKHVSAPIAGARQVTPSAPPADPPPPPYEQRNKTDPKIVVDAVRRLPIDKTDEYLGLNYRQKLKLYSVMSLISCSPLSILELGAAPGTWMQLLLRKFPRAQYHAVSSEQGLKYETRPTTPKLTFFDIDVFDYFDNNDKQFDLVVSDIASQDSWKDSSEQMRIAASVRKRVHNGSSVVIKFSNVFASIDTIVDLYAGFHCGFVKPIGSRARSTEVYFVATPTVVNFSKLEAIRESMLTSLHSLLLSPPKMPLVPTADTVSEYFEPTDASSSEESEVEEEPKSRKEEDPKSSQDDEKPSPREFDPEGEPLHVSASKFLVQYRHSSYYHELLTDDCTIIDVPRDGYCLYHALTAGCVHNLHGLIDELKELAALQWGTNSDRYKKYIEAKDSSREGDIDDIELFSRLFEVKVVVYDFAHSYRHNIGEGNSIIKVAYDGTHYYSILHCPAKVSLPPDHDMSPTVFNDRAYMLWLDNTISKDAVREKSLPAKALNYVARVATTVTGHLQNLTDADKTIFVIQRYCDKHVSCNFKHLTTKIESTQHQTYTVALWNNTKYLDKFWHYVRQNDLYCQAVGHPMIYKSGYCVFKIRKCTTHDTRHSPVAQAAFINHHMTICDRCPHVKSWQVLAYHYITKTGIYTTCAQTLATVIPVTEYVNDITVYKLVPNKGMGFSVTTNGDFVLIGVRFDSVHAIDGGCLKHVMIALTTYLEQNQLFKEALQFDGVGASNTAPIIEKLRAYCTVLYDKINVADTSVLEMKFRPITKSPYCRINKRKNACYEALEMARYDKVRIIDELERYARAQKSMILRNSTNTHKTLVATSTGKLAAIDFNVGKYAIKKCDFDYKGVFAKGFSYEQDAVVDLADCYIGDEPVPKAGYGIVAYTKECRMFNSDRIYNTINARIDLLERLDAIYIVYVDGAPGVGKTRYILDNLTGNSVDTSEMVLSIGKHSAETFRLRAVEKFGYDETTARKKFRTLDSLLMHYNDEDYPPDLSRTLYIDEGMMEHVGKLLWAALLLNAKKLIIIGDEAQIPFINRDKTRRLHYNKIVSIVPDENAFTTLAECFISYRIPPDVAHILNRLKAYRKVIRTYNQLMHSIKLVVCPQGNYDVLSRKFDQHATSPLAALRDHYTPDTVVLTFTQSDKKTIIEHLKSNRQETRVHTVHEFQGSEAKKVIFIRLSAKYNPVYDERSQALVGLSRHTHEFLYITPVCDNVAKIITNYAHETNDIKKLCVALKGGGILAGPRQNKQYPVFLVNYTAPKTFDLLKQNVFLREFVIANRGYNIIPTRANLQPIDMPIPTDPVIPTNRVGDPVNILQSFIDYMIPGGSTRIMDYDNLRFEEEPFYVTNSCTLREVARIKSSRFDSCSSSLRTHCPMPVWDTQKQYLKAFGERNGGVPDYGGTRDNVALVDEMYTSFKTAYLKEERLTVFEGSEIDINVDALEDWLKEKPTSVLELMKSDEDYSIFDKKLDTYSMMLKKLPKIVTDAEAAYKNKSPQTILYHCQAVNAVFSPIVREMKSRLVSSLLANKVIATDMSVDELEDLMSTRFPPSMLRDYCQTAEGDIGKFDKSQELLALMFELKIMTTLGFPQKYVGLWVYMHVYTRMIARNAGFSAHVHYQRKSGDAMTFLGNTLFLMAVVAHTYGADITRRAVGWFAGDDYYLFTQDPIDMSDSVERFAMTFNLELKVMTKKTPYFCSKFFVPTVNNRWKMIPDIVKTVIKLGRRDLVNRQHIAEFRQSLKDLYRNFDNVLYVPYLDYCLADRYKPYGSEQVYSAIFTIINDDEHWNKLYYAAAGAVIDENRGFSRQDF